MTSINSSPQSLNYSYFQANNQSQNALKNPANAELAASIAGIQGAAELSSSSSEAGSVVAGIGQVLDILV